MNHQRSPDNQWINSGDFSAFDWHAGSGPGSSAVSLEARLASPPSLEYVRKELAGVLHTRAHLDASVLARTFCIPERFPEVLETLRLCMSDPFPQEAAGGTAFPNPFRAGSLIRDNFVNIGQHCIVTACVADLFCRDLEETGRIQAGESAEIVRSAALHDAGKFLYILRRDVALDEQARRRLSALEHTAEDFEILKDLFGVPEHLARSIVNMARLTGGLDCYREFFSLDEENRPRVCGDLMTLLVRAADDMVMTSIPPAGASAQTILVTPGERMLFHALNPHYHDHVFRSGFGFQREQRQLVHLDFSCPLPQGVIRIATYAQVHSFISCSTLERLKVLSGRQSPLPADRMYLADLYRRL